jgi:hypothetical protein
MKYLKEFFQIAFTFSLTGIAWIFFRANSVHHALNYVCDIFLFRGNRIEIACEQNLYYLLTFFIITEWLGRNGNYAIHKIDFCKWRWLRWTFYILLIIFILFFSGSQQDFIYFQF